MIMVFSYSNSGIEVFINSKIIYGRSAFVDYKSWSSFWYWWKKTEVVKPVNHTPLVASSTYSADSQREKLEERWANTKTRPGAGAGGSGEPPKPFNPQG